MLHEDFISVKNTLILLISLKATENDVELDISTQAVLMLVLMSSSLYSSGVRS